MQKSQRLFLPLAFFVFTPLFLFSQSFTRSDSVPVIENGKTLRNPWAGGHNYVQPSVIDLNFDGINDLFLFDRSGHRVITYINNGTTDSVDYTHAPAYADSFPLLEDWVLLKDYDCDGKVDIFTYAITCGGIKVWKNTSTANKLQFTLAVKLYNSCPCLTSTYGASLSNLYITRVDLPALEDIDNDGDLDILTFNFGGTQVEYHVNQSVELGYNCDSLIYVLDPSGCWGNFQEDPFNCSVSLSSCRTIPPDSIPYYHTQKTELHSGSCSVCLDMDADGDKEIIVGDISCCNLTLLTNGGSPTSASITAKDSLFPSNDIPASLSVFPCGFFFDADNDNKRDLIVAPNAPNISLNHESTWFYKNTGADNAPVFKRQTRSFLQDQMVDAGESSNPVFFDYDQDGLTDILISSYSMISDSCPSSNEYGVWAYRNTGTIIKPRYELDTLDFAGLNTKLPSLPGKFLTFGDLNGDGDQDMVVGDWQGNLTYFDNSAGPGNPCVFQASMLPGCLTNKVCDDNTDSIDVGAYSTPQLIDIDRDNDLDLIIGERTGNLNYYENIGTASSPTFTLMSSNFGGVNVLKFNLTGYSVPYIYDSAGAYKMFVGSEANKAYPPTGWLWKFDNIDGNLAGNFNLVDSMYQNIWEGSRMTVNGSDINNDGLLDIIIGNLGGGMALYLGTSNPVSTTYENTLLPDFNLFPNPGAGKFGISTSGWEPEQITILSLHGQIMDEWQVSSKGDLNFDLLNYSPGVYICKVSQPGKFAFKKFTIIY